MRLCYCSDLHLEAQEFRGDVAGGDVLVIAGDLCHARTLEADPDDGYATAQRERVLRFMDMIRPRFARVILVPGNHDHYDGVIDDTADIFRRRLDVTVLDGEAVELDGGVSLFGATLWSDFEGRDEAAMKRAGKGCGEFFFVKRRDGDDLVRFRPADALAAHDRAMSLLRAFLDRPGRTIVVSHHAPSRKGLNPLFSGNGLDGAYASDLDGMIEAVGPSLWIHGHTHVRRSYRIGTTDIRANCLGFYEKDPHATHFAVASVDI